MMRADRLRRAAARLAAAVALLAAPAGGAEEAAPPPAHFEKLLAGLAGEKAFIERVLAEFRPAPHLRPVLARHVRNLYSSEAVIRGLAAELSQSFGLISADGPDAARDLAQQFGAAWVQENVAAGVEHLPPADQRTILSYAALALRQMPEEDCAAAVKGTASAMVLARAEIDALATLSAAKVSAYFALSLRAIEAELLDHPVVVPLTVTELAFANRAFDSAMQTLIAARPATEADAIVAAAGNWETASDRALCDLALLSIEAAVSVRGAAGDWVVRMINAE